MTNHTILVTGGAGCGISKALPAGYVDVVCRRVSESVVPR